MRPPNPDRYADAVVIRSWQVQDGGFRAQVRQQVPGQTTSRQPVHEIALAYRPRDGALVRIKATRSEGWKCAD